ncbi:MAG TPA: MT-A70 family methyltransferase, partial [Candidatus Cybelea sp.]|nr:MT-A70 family methyltransferase [Candidatus Cybelea sp.]
WAKRSRRDRSWQFGTGYLLRSAAEFFLIGTRGHPRSAVHNVRNLIVAPVREHSRKPDDLAKNLERMFPDAKKIELFAERKRKGWATWGKPTGRF